jgi:hypothetical protein
MSIDFFEKEYKKAFIPREYLNEYNRQEPDSEADSNTEFAKSFLVWKHSGFLSKAGPESMMTRRGGLFRNRCFQFFS